jgi:hypothetical protein
MASRAAASEHDARIGRVGAYHLFRLPTGEEAELRDFVQSTDGRTTLEALAALQSKEARLDALADLAGDEPPSSTRGPVECGTVTGFHRGRVFARMCSTYLKALREGSPSYPYLEEMSP